MIITARFIGEDGSLGYKKGRVYTLELKGSTISRLVGKASDCPYSSVEAFLKNWELMMHAR